MRKVLVVDDYRPFLEEMRQTVSDEKTTVSTAESAADAIRQIEADSFDLVITDLYMETNNSQDGISVIKAAKADELTQVIVVTAYGRPELSKTSMQLGAFDYLERGTPGTHFRAMLNRKIFLALDYRSAKQALLRLHAG